MSKLNEIKKIYFIGIGGIGMSALARYFKANGVDVSGYDKTSTPLTRELEAAGIAIHYHSWYKRNNYNYKQTEKHAFQLMWIEVPVESQKIYIY